METSLEAQWRSQSLRRRRILNLMLLALLGLALLCVAFWFWVTQPLFTTTTNVAHASVSAERLEKHVRKLANDLGPRDESRPANLDRVAAYIKTELQNARGNVSEQVFQVNGKIYRNVTAQFGPETAERIVVGAHYDTAGPFPGADDNASGVAGLIELGVLLGEAQLPMRVELVAFTLEEPPYFRTDQMGSAVHATSLKSRGAGVRAMLSVEMIGYFSDKPSSQRFPAPFLGAFYPSEGNFIGVVSTFGGGLLARRVKAAMRRAAVPVYSISAPAFVPGVDFSDQLNYWKAGYPALMITDTAFYRNENYHTELDTPEKLDYRRMALVVEGVYLAVLDLAGH